MRNGRGSAFSLIEMLVVVGVILLLVGMLYPALLKTKEWGRAVKCASNLRQLYFATQAYVQDESRRTVYGEDQTYPDSTSWWLRKGPPSRPVYVEKPGWVGWKRTPPVNTYPPDYHAWAGVDGSNCIKRGTIWQYTSNTVNYLCPTFAQRSVCGTNDAVLSYSMVTGVLSVARDSGTPLDPRYKAGKPYAHQSIISAQTILYADDGCLTNRAIVDKDPQMATNEVGRWHNGKGQAVFADGHVERL